MKAYRLVEELANTLTKEEGQDGKATLADVKAEALDKALADGPRRSGGRVTWRKIGQTEGQGNT